MHRLILVGLLVVGGCEAVAEAFVDAAQEALADSFQEAFFGPASRPVGESLRSRIEDHCDSAARTAEAEVTERYKAKEAQPGGRRGFRKLGRYLAETYKYSNVKEDCLLDHASEQAAVSGGVYLADSEQQRHSHR